LDVLFLASGIALGNNRFCGLKGHEMFCEVERSYIEDGFNLYGLRACVSNFSDCLDLILDRIGPDDSDDSHLTQSACTLYGLIHARYIITAHGLDAMYNKVSLGKEKKGEAALPA
jgi:casein kinase II subunit beta